MPELPELEIVSRLVGDAVRGAKVRSVHVTAINTLKSFDPPISQIEGATITGVGRRGKHLMVEFREDLSLLVHLMSAGRLQLFREAGSRSDRTTRLSLTLEDQRQLRLREFGTRQSCWAKLVPSTGLEHEDVLATLGPEAWPSPPPFKELLDEPRPLHTLLRDQRVIAGIGRSWVDEILHRAMLSPFKRGNDLTATQADDLRSGTLEKLGAAIDHYERTLDLPIPDKLPMPLEVHGRKGLPCPRCGTRLEAVRFEDHEMTYCPLCQTGGRLLKDRRLSRLLK